MNLHATRILRTPHSERFVLRKADAQEFAALELHFLADGSVAGTLILFEEARVPESDIPAILRAIDEDLLPEVSIAEQNLSFTVVVGKLVGSFVPHGDEKE